MQTFNLPLLNNPISFWYTEIPTANTNRKNYFACDAKGRTLSSTTPDYVDGNL